MNVKLSPITKQQWVSVVKNAVFAGLVGFVITLQQQGNVDKAGLLAAATAGAMAALKIAEKAFTQG